MTRRKNQLTHIEKIKKNQYSLALLKLKEKIDAYEEAKNRLLMLEHYAAEYQVSNTQTTMSIGTICQRQSFLDNLAITIHEQNRCVEYAFEGLKKAQAEIEETYKEHRGIEILLDQEKHKEKMEKLAKESEVLEEQIMMQHNRKRSSP